MIPHYANTADLHKLIEDALREDIRGNDHSVNATVPGNLRATGTLLAKSDGVLAGVQVAQSICMLYDSELLIKSYKADGEKIYAGDIVLTISGSAGSIIKIERLLLNCLQRMSGIATKTAHLVQLIEGTGAKLLDTRKTTPNFRMLEKWAVLIGGGVNHRFGLFDMIMLKDNHIEACGGVTTALEKAYNYVEKKNLDIKIEVETRTLDEVLEVARYGKADRVMLDNMPPQMMREALKILDGKFETEASGNITEATIREVALTGINYISVGALTHSYTSVDLSLKIKTL